MKSRTHRKCYCAFCGTERSVYQKRHISVVDVLLVSVASGLASIIVWQDLDPRAVVFLAFGLGISEIFVLFRWRLSIACRKCGFDPVLYKKSPEKAALRVREFMEDRRQGSLHILLPAPRLPAIVKKVSK